MPEGVLGGVSALKHGGVRIMFVSPSLRTAGLTPSGLGFRSRDPTADGWDKDNRKFR